MNSKGKISILVLSIIVVVGIFFTIGLMLVGTGISVYNKNVDLTTKYKAQVKSNEVIYDKVWKVISQKAQISNAAADKFKDVYTNIMDARYGNTDNVMMNWIQEQNPQFDNSLFKDLSQSVEGLRAEFAMIQQKLIDIKREHDVFRTKFPNTIYCMVLGIKELELKIVTSSKTEKAFEIGKDDDVKLF